MRILMHSNAPWVRSGYGIQAALLGPRIKRLGHALDYSANYGLQGSVANLDETSRVFPSLTSQQRDVMLLPGHAKAAEADIVMTLYDAWVLPPQVTRQFRWVPLVPIEHEHVPEVICQSLAPAWRVIAYSRYGQERLSEVGIEALYLPHMVDTTVYYPHPRAAARQELGFPEDAFVAVMVGMNKGFPCRKSFPEVLRAWADFSTQHPDVFLYLHTNSTAMQGGPDLREMVAATPFDHTTVRFPDLYEYCMGFPFDKMAALYSAADVLLMPSQSEGFGVPLVEAQCCGCPVITTDFGPMRELLFAGWPVKAQPAWSATTGWVRVPLVESIREGLEAAYGARGDTDLRVRARMGASAYDADRVAADYLGGVLETLEGELRGGGAAGLLQTL